jgi:hypothetical protein
LRFRLDYLLTVILASAGIAGAYLAAPRTSKRVGRTLTARRHPIPAERWGHAMRYRHLMVVTLGPAADRRRRYEAGTARISYSAAALAVSDDGGRTFHDLTGQPMGACGYHWFGFGVNAITAVASCVPWWATEPGGTHAHQWLRIENLVPRPRFVVMRLGT